MTTAHILYLKMVKEGMVINADTLDTLKEALREGNIHFLFNAHKIIGFFTWYEEKKDEVVMNNLVISKAYRGTFNLLTTRHVLLDKYPNLIRVRWYDQKKNKVVIHGCRKA